MKLLLLIVSIIAVLTVDTIDFPDRSDGTPGRIFPNGHQWRDSSKAHLKKRNVGAQGPRWHDYPDAHQRPDIEEVKDQIKKEERGRKCRGKPSLECTFLGGYCVHKTSSCKGRRVTGGCKRCDCCIPVCPYEEGFFSPYGSKQCFKFFDDIDRNWTDANAKCHAEKPGLVLAHPYNAIALRSYMVQRFGPYSYTWLNARGVENYPGEGYITWQDNWVQIYDYNPLWYPGEPFNTTDPYCLILLSGSWYWAENSTRPYAVEYCDNPYYYTLCELVIDGHH